MSDQQLYQLPFKPTDVVAEFGGSDNPTFHPNYDIRQLPGVDHVIDFNKHFDIPDLSFNGIYSKYLLEHLSWRRVKAFLKEIYRILKPNGTAVFITANLLEQAKVIANYQKLNDDFICMIFGGQKFGNSTDLNDELEENWDSNSHHSGFDPQYITEILSNIGFVNTKVFNIQTVHGITDMVVETSKPDKKDKDIDISLSQPMIKGWTNIKLI